jgi:pimeloyl-ACP methyl ester carboxylesterase
VSFLTRDDGVRLRYTDRGKGDHTIVLVHGWKGSHRMWDPAVYRLMREFRVIAFDNRGMGESDKPGGKYDLDVLADDLEFVLATLDARDVTLVGWSMGCSISLQYLANGGERAAGLVLINGPIKLEQTPDFPWGIEAEQLHGYLEDAAANWPQAELDFARGATLDPDSAFSQLYYQVALQTPLETAMRIVEEQLKLDHSVLLPKLSLPVLALYGDKDPYYPNELAKYIAETVQNGEWIIFEQSAHAVHYDEPDRFAHVIGEFARGRLERGL